MVTTLTSGPEYDERYCGFNDMPGCIPLNGYSPSPPTFPNSEASVCPDYNTPNSLLPSCGTVGAIPFMLVFVLIVAMIFVNLFIGVILEGFDLANER